LPQREANALTQVKVFSKCYGSTDTKHVPPSKTSRLCFAVDRAKSVLGVTNTPNDFGLSSIPPRNGARHYSLRLSLMRLTCSPHFGIPLVDFAAVENGNSKAVSERRRK
jgi:hypothetical protein